MRTKTQPDSKKDIRPTGRVEHLKKKLTINDTSYQDNPFSPEVPNTSWMCNCFLLPKDAISDLDRERRYYTSADRKFGDCSLGGGKVLNQPPGFTRNADIPAGDALRKDVPGYGPCYSEAIDDNLDIIHIRPGMAEYNALTNFYAYMYNKASGDLANRGTTSAVSSIIGTVAGLLVAAPIVAYVTIGRFIRWAQGKPYSSYYYLKPTTSLYWSALQQAVNMFAAKAGYIPAVETNSWENGRPELENSGLTKEQIDAFNKLLPDIYRSDNNNAGIDIFAVANRYKRLEIAHHRKMRSIQEEPGLNYNDTVKKMQEVTLNDFQSDGIENLNSMLDSYNKSPIGKGETDMKPQDDNFINKSLQGIAEAFTGLGWDSPGGYEDTFRTHFEAELKSGSSYVSLAVNYIGETSTSVNNSTGESPVASAINGIVASSRTASHAMAYGNLGSNVVADTAEAILALGKTALGSFADTVGLSFVNAMAGNGFVDIPNIWQDSTSEMPKHQYTIEFNSASAHPLSKLQNIYIPVLALITLAYPLSTGNKSYTSPFLVELHHKGKNKISLGMIADLQIQFGDGEPGSWDFMEFPNHATATFSVVNLSNKIHVPITANATDFMNDSNNFSDMLDVMASLGLYDQESKLMELKRAKANFLQNTSDFTSPAYWAQLSAGVIKSTAIDWFLPITNRND